MVGCAAHPIAEHFEPLEQLSERPFGGGNFVTTIGSSVWVDDIDDFLARRPEGSVSYNGLMLHERVHSIRQGNPLTAAWFVVRYLLDRDYMWEEEQLARYFEFHHLKNNNGKLQRPEYYATVLSSYRGLTGKMVSFHKALAWVKDVMSGKWSPILTPEEWENYGLLKKFK